ncbi:MAG TPA: MFS transporter [Chloroflexia bacterium]|jgi:MFS family permease
MSVQQSEHRMGRPDIATHFVRWSCLRAVLHSGYWLVTSLYLVVDAGLSPYQLVLIGVAQGIVSLLFEIPTGVMADTISRKWSLVIFHILVGISMVITGLVTSFPALLATQMLWGIAWTFASGADIALITDELNYPERTAVVLAAQARWQQIGAASGMLGFGALAWATNRSTAMVGAGGMMALLGLYVVGRFTERHFTPAHAQRWQRAAAILRRGVALARRDPEILVVFVATFLVNGAADTFGRLYPKQLVGLGFPNRLDPIVWFTGLGIVTFVAGALALRIVEARIASAGVARRAYAAACGLGVLGVLLLAAAPDSMTGSAGVLLATGMSWTVTRAVGVIWVNSRTTSDVRATVQSFLAQVEYSGEILCGLALAAVVQATSITGALVGASALVACAGVMVMRSLASRD